MFFKTDVFKILAKLILVHRVIYSSSPSQIFFKMDFLKNFANFTGKRLCWGFFLIKLQAWRRIKIKKMEDWNMFRNPVGEMLWRFKYFAIKYFKLNLSLRLLSYYLFTNLLRKKMSKYGVYSGSYFFVFCPNTGKYGPEVTPYLETFHAVVVYLIICWFTTLFRSSRPVFCKKGVLKNFAKFSGKHLCHSLFLNKVACLRPATLLKKRF